jgi:hypothetical protein
MTEVAFTTAVACTSGASASSSIASRVIAAVTRRSGLDLDPGHDAVVGD